MQMTLEHLLAQKFEQRTEWIAEVFTINECIGAMPQN